ncbi:MAG: ion transporter, partial [Pseudomonadota bacterium]
NDHYGELLTLANRVILWIFVVEVILKLTAVWPRVSEYFADPWNVFDFLIVAVSLVPATGEFATVARLLRLLRVMRLISAIPELKLIVATLVRSIPSMGHVILLMSILFYVYGVAGYHLFHEADPTHWRNLGISLLTLFRIVTLEDWTDVMYAAMAAYPWAWVYFVSFVVTGTFVVVNLFIAVVLNNLEESKAETLAKMQAPLSRDELLRELRATQDALGKLQRKIERFPDEEGPGAQG